MTESTDHGLVDERERRILSTDRLLQALDYAVEPTDAVSHRVGILVGVGALCMAILLILLWSRNVKSFKQLREIWLMAILKKGNASVLFRLFLYCAPSCLILGGMQQGFDLALKVAFTLIPIGVFLGFLILIIRMYRGLQTKSIQRQPPAAALNVYEDFSSPISRVIVIGMMQIVLLGMFGWGILEEGSPDFTNPRIHIFYWTGALMQIGYLIHKDPMCRIDHYRLHMVCYWAHAFDTLKRNGSFQNNESEKLLQANWASFTLRCFLSILINTSGLLLVMFGLPIQVAATDAPIDFVLNVVAAGYIIELDDIDGGTIIFHVNETEKRKNLKVRQNIQLTAPHLEKELLDICCPLFLN